MKGYQHPNNEYKNSPGLSNKLSGYNNQASVNPHTSSKPNLDKLKMDYNNAIIDDMFPTRD